MDLWVREARLFKYGSGTGSNFSSLRGENEKLSGGGKSSGLMSFLKIGDRAAGAIKSGGTTRRAAKMVVVDVDHPDIEAFIDWKVKEEEKVAALVAGSKIAASTSRRCCSACVNCEGQGDDCFDPEKNPALKREIKLARRAMVPDALHQARHPVRAPGLQGHRFRRHTTPIGTPRPISPSRARTPTTPCASPTTSCSAVEEDGEWTLIRRIDGKVAQDLHARALWDKIGYAAWASRRSRPAIPHHHQRLAHLPGRRRDPRVEIRARNTCSSTTPPAIWPRSTCCNSATRRRPSASTSTAYEHAVRLWTHGARNLGADGAVPLARKSPSFPMNTARWASATPISAAC